MVSVRKFEYTIDERWEGKPVKALLQHYGFSAAVINGLKKNPKGIMLGNKRVTVLKQMHAGDKLTLRVRDREESMLEPVKLPIEIIYEDEDIAVVNKPADMPTHPVQNNHTATLGNALAYHWQQMGKSYVYHPVNRLDKDTTGLLIVAKHAYAAGRLSAALQDRQISRTYLALVEGALSGSGTVDAPIVRCENSVIQRKVGDPQTAGDKAKAVTHFTVLKNLPDCTLIRLKLETGRTHQIRVHMAHIGHPLCGDWLYGREGYITNRPALHSHCLDFVHPVSGKPLHFTAPLPQDMQNAAGISEIEL